MTHIIVPGHMCGMPVTVETLFDSEEFQCIQCRRRFTTASMLIAHTSDCHKHLIKGTNPQTQ
jgi:hypothetical protein